MFWVVRDGDKVVQNMAHDAADEAHSPQSWHLSYSTLNCTFGILTQVSMVGAHPCNEQFKSTSFWGEVSSPGFSHREGQIMNISTECWICPSMDFFLKFSNPISIFYCTSMLLEKEYPVNSDVWVKFRWKRNPVTRLAWGPPKRTTTPLRTHSHTQNMYVCIV